MTSKTNSLTRTPQPIKPSTHAHHKSSPVLTKSHQTPQRGEIPAKTSPAQATEAIMATPRASNDSSAASRAELTIRASPRLAMGSPSQLEYGIFGPNERAASVSASSTQCKPAPKSLSFLNSIKRRLGMEKMVNDEEAQKRLKGETLSFAFKRTSLISSTYLATISGPSIYNPGAEDPNLDVNSYLQMHCTFNVPNPQIEHPEVGPETFRHVPKQEEAPGEEGASA